MADYLRCAANQLAQQPAPELFKGNVRFPGLGSGESGAAPAVLAESR